MRIVLINYRYFVTGGPERYLMGVERLLRDAGHAVAPFSFDYEQNEPTPYRRYFPPPPLGAGSVFYKDARLTPMQKLRVLGKTLYNREAAGKLRALLREERIEAAYVLQAVNTLYPAVVDVCHEAGVPVVYRLSDFQFVCANYKLFRQGCICEECVSGGRYYRGLMHRCLKGSLSVSAARVASMYLDVLRGTRDKVSLFVTPSRIVQQKMIEGGFDPRRVAHLSTFIDAGAYTPRYEPGDYVLYAGAIEPFKGVEVLIDAFALLGRPGARLVIAGYSLGDEEDRLRAKVERERITGVEFVGFQKGRAYQELVRGARCVAAPVLWYENLPNAVLEAMAMGKPVIGSNLGGVAELIDDGRDGLLAPPGDRAAWRDKLALLLDDAALAQQLGKAARQKVEQVYHPQQHLAKLTGIFESVLAQRRRGLA
ncbi:MAG TPA: glycosyltransferase family 4 protein [Phycisphaeraceae bacterium]